MIRIWVDWVAQTKCSSFFFFGCMVFPDWAVSDDVLDEIKMSDDERISYISGTHRVWHTTIHVQDNIFKHFSIGTHQAFMRKRLQFLRWNLDSRSHWEDGVVGQRLNSKSSVRCGCELDGCVVCCSDSTCGNVWNKMSIIGCNDVCKPCDSKLRRGHPSGDEHGGCAGVMLPVATEKIDLCSAWHVAVGSVINHRCVYSKF